MNIAEIKFDDKHRYEYKHLARFTKYEPISMSLIGIMLHNLEISKGRNIFDVEYDDSSVNPLTIFIKYIVRNKYYKLVLSNLGDSYYHCTIFISGEIYKKYIFDQKYNLVIFLEKYFKKTLK